LHFFLKYFKYYNFIGIWPDFDILIHGGDPNHTEVILQWRKPYFILGKKQTYFLVLKHRPYSVDILLPDYCISQFLLPKCCHFVLSQLSSLLCN
jgi:hypothetical protein